MSTVFLLPDDPTYDSVGFDITTVESHSRISHPTDNPTERGVIVSDHVISEPDAFTCEVMVSNTPHRVTWFGDGVRGNVSLSVPQFGGRGAVYTAKRDFYGFHLSRSANLVAEMHERLIRLQDDRVLMTVITSTIQYNGMLLVGVTLPRGPSSIGKGVFQLAFRRLITVETRTTAAPKPKEPRGAPKVAKGAQGQTSAVDAVKGNLKSWGAQLVDGDLDLSKLMGGLGT